MQTFAKRFGTANVTVYYDRTGEAARRYSKGYFPDAAFFTSKGKRRAAFSGWPG